MASSLPGAPVPVPLDGSEPCAAGSSGASRLVRRLRRLLDLGVPVSALSSSFVVVHTASNRLHASCSRPTGARSVSAADLASSSCCVCVDDLLEYDPALGDLFEALDTFDGLAEDLPSSKWDPEVVLAGLAAVEDELDYQLDLPEFSVPREALRSQLRTEALRAARRLRSSPAFATAYARVSLAAVEEVAAESDLLSSADAELLLGESPCSSEVQDLTWSLVDAWSSGATRSERLTFALDAVGGHLLEELDPATLRFVPASAPPRGALVGDWLLAERAAARRRVLSSLVDGLEARLSVPATSQGALVVVPPSVRGDLGDDLLLVLDASRFGESALPVSLVPAHLGEWARMLVEDSDRGEVVLLDGASPQVVETALALWDSCADGPLTSLGAALEAARRV